MQDQTMQCKDCGKDFVWTIGEQEFYQKKGFDNKPSRCPDCRKMKKQNFGDNNRGGGSRGGGGGDRRMYEITCSKCGAKDSVPFEPREGRDVLCRNCFQSAR